MANSVRAEIREVGGNIEAKLARLEALSRGPVVKDALTAAAKVVIGAAKRRVTQPGYKGDKPGKKPLRDTIAYVTRKYRDGTRQVAVVGPQYPAGAHGHLVEFGHQKVLWGKPTSERVPPHPFLRPAADETQLTQSAAIDTVLRQAIEAEAKR